MGKINGRLTAELQGMFGNRVSFYPLERKLYGHDTAAMPGLIKPLVGKGIPEAVVQPQTEAELVALVRWAVRTVSVDPTRKASTGYGGVIPVRGGIVDDFYYMMAVKHTMRKNQTPSWSWVGWEC
jgi:FAD/FMN-containing dehydrogenase